MGGFFMARRGAAFRRFGQSITVLSAASSQADLMKTLASLRRNADPTQVLAAPYALPRGPRIQLLSNACKRAACKQSVGAARLFFCAVDSSAKTTLGAAPALHEGGARYMIRLCSIQRLHRFFISCWENGCPPPSKRTWRRSERR